MKTVVSAVLLLAGLSAAAGTLIFRNAASGSVDIISRAEITAIADGMAEFAHGKTRSDREHFLVALADIIRFDAENIDVEHRELDDGSADYSVQLAEVVTPTKRNPNELTVSYSIRRNLSAGDSSAIRRPYIFVTLLTETAARDGSKKRKRITLAAPSAAASGLKNEFNYMKVMEKLLDPNREMWYPEDDRSRGPGNHNRGNSEETFKITGSNVTLLAYQVTIWGKYQIADSKTWADRQADADWLTRQY